MQPLMNRVKEHSYFQTKQLHIPVLAQSSWIINKTMYIIPELMAVKTLHFCCHLFIIYS